MRIATMGITMPVIRFGFWYKRGSFTAFYYLKFIIFYHIYHIGVVYTKIRTRKFHFCDIDFIHFIFVNYYYFTASIGLFFFWYFKGDGIRRKVFVRFVYE